MFSARADKSRNLHLQLIHMSVRLYITFQVMFFFTSICGQIKIVSVDGQN